MLKRLLWLSLCCAAFCLLLGLMVRHQSDAPLPPRQAVVFGALPAQAAPGEQAAEEARQVASPAAPLAITGEAFAKAAPAPLQQAFHLENYHAFHYSDEAG